VLKAKSGIQNKATAVWNIFKLWTFLSMTTHTHTKPFYSPLGFCLEPPGWAGTRKVKPIWIYWSKRKWVAVASTGPYANLHLDPDTLPRQHHTTEFLQAGCPSCSPTNSVKSLKAQYDQPH